MRGIHAVVLFNIMWKTLLQKINISDLTGDQDKNNPRHFIENRYNLRRKNSLQLMCKYGYRALHNENGDHTGPKEHEYLIEIIMQCRTNV